MKRARSDLEKVILFLCRMVSKIDVDFWKNLKILLSWVKETIYDKIIFVAMSLTGVYT